MVAVNVDAATGYHALPDGVKKPLLEEMTWIEARRAAQHRGRVMLLPVGAIEQHGPHLPVDVDNRIVTWMCDQAARQRPDLILSVPPIHYGFNEHDTGFPHTVSVEVNHFMDYVYKESKGVYKNKSLIDLRNAADVTLQQATRKILYARL